MPSRPGWRTVPRDDAPHSAHRCAGEDRWLAIAARTDAEWRALTAIGGAALAGTRDSPTWAGAARQDEIKALITTWGCGQDARPPRDGCGRRAVPAPVVAALSDLLAPAAGSVISTSSPSSGTA